MNWLEISPPPEAHCPMCGVGNPLIDCLARCLVCRACHQSFFWIGVAKPSETK